MKFCAIMLTGLALVATGGCRGAEKTNSANAQTPAANMVAAPAANETSVQTVERVDGNGQRILTKELTGPNVMAPDARPLNMDEIEEIEKATGRPYQEGDSIYGRAEPVKNGQ